MPHMIMEHEKDPKQAILDNLKDVSEVELFQNQVLVAIYIRPKKTKSGIYLADSTVDEDRYQSKVGLYVKGGPQAFDSSAQEWFGGATFELNDWLVFRPSDGWSITVNNVLCRILTDTQVKARIQHPDQVW